MLGFLNSIFLFGLFAAFIPFIIHFFAKRKKKILPFSTLFFLKEMQSKSIRRVHIQQWILLLCRFLALCCLALAFAVPVSRGIFSNGVSDTAGVVIIDQSMSMMRDKIQDNMTETVNYVLNAFSENDDFFLLGTHENKEARRIFEFNNAFLQPIFDHGDISASVSDALLNLKRKDKANRELYLISDFQRSLFENIDTVQACQSWDGSLFCVQLKGSQENVALHHIEMKNQILELDGPLTLSAEISNLGTQPVNNQRIRLYLNDKPVAQRLIDLPPGSVQTVYLNHEIHESGWLSLQMSLEKDEFVCDNSQYFSTHIPRTLNLLYWGQEEKKEKVFKNILISSNGKGQLFHWMNAADSRNALEELDKAQLIIMEDCAAINPEQGARLIEYMKNGGGLIVFSGEKTNAAELNRNLLEKIEMGYLGNLKKANLSSEGYWSMSGLELNHAVFRKMFTEKAAVRSPRFFKYLQFNGKVPVILEASSGDPLIVEKKWGRGKLILITTSLQESWSDLMTTALFPPLIHRLALFASASMQGAENAFVTGRSIDFYSNQLVYGKSVEMTFPDGSMQLTSPEFLPGGLARLSIDGNMPGIYQISQNHQLIAKAAFNVPETESDFTSVTENQIKDFFPNASVQWIEVSHQIPEIISKSRWGQSYGTAFFIAALFFLIVELLISRTGLFAK